MKRPSSASAAKPAKRTRTKKQEAADSIRNGGDAADGQNQGKLLVLREERGLDGESGQLQSTSDSKSNVLYLGHIPHGFYEHQLRGYFSQFGEVLRIRLSRSKSTGKSKGYAFLEFESAEVAKIAADSMHDYLMFGQKLVCRIVASEELHPHTFKGSERRFKKIPWRKIESERHNKDRTEKEEAKRQRRLAAKDRKRKAKIARAGIDYEFDGFAPAKNDEKKTPAKRRAPAKEQTPVKKPAVATKKTPAKKPTAVAKKTPAKKPAAVAKKTPAKEPKQTRAKKKQSPPKQIRKSLRIRQKAGA